MKKIFVMILFTSLISVFNMSTLKKDNDFTEELPIAKLTIFSFDGKSETKNFIKSYGHTFLVLTNLEQEELNLYGYSLKKGDCVCFSWWAIDLHMGIWFNIESNYIKYYNRFDTRYSYSINITSSDVKKISDYLSENDYYTPLKNCSKMSICCWNTVAKEKQKIKVAFVNTPGYVIKQIKKFDNAVYQEDITANDKIGYFNREEFVSFKMEIRYD